MNYRRKLISLDIPFVGDRLKFSLQAFEFSNNEKTILGCIRWIPKLIANNGDNDKIIVPIDNYQPMANLHPIPLTTARAKRASNMKKCTSKEKKQFNKSRRR